MKRSHWIVLLIVVAVFAIAAKLLIDYTHRPMPAPSVPAETSTPDVSTYTDPSGAFSFENPEKFAAERNADASPGELTKVTIPKSFQSGTNFSEATFTIHTMPAIVATSVTPPQKVCPSPEDNDGAYAKGTTEINGVTYDVFALGDAGAGNFYETTWYQTMQNDTCYSVSYVIHSTNIGAYSPDQGIKEFDKAKVTAALEAMARSFKILK